MKRTKIIATIGPASDSKETLKKMIEAGVNVVRINFSHGTHASNGQAIKLAQELSQEMHVPVGVMADLQGPRLRVGNAKEIKVEPGEVILVGDKETSSEKELLIDFPGVSSSLKIGDRILIEDGLIELRVVSRSGKNAKAKAMHKAIIRPRKGINVPDTRLPFGAVTKKDEADLEFALSQNVDFVALSFVSNAEEIRETRKKIKKILGRDHDLPHLIPKIERGEALKNLDEIVEAADAVMVARGDLGVDMEESMVAIYQKEIIEKCLKHVRPVIVATQMLDSMIEKSIPTRAEVSDVSNAVIDHTDAVMLSGESANGQYPVEAVQMMSDIIKNTEASPFDDIQAGFLDREMFSDYASTINSAHEMAKSSNAKAIVLFTTSGLTARMLSHHRPDQMILAATDNPKTYQQLALVWGVEACLCKVVGDKEKMIAETIAQAKADKKLKTGDKIVVLTGKYEGDKMVKLVGLQEV